MKLIEIIVSPSGQSTVQTKGFTGASCREASRFLLETLGPVTAERLTGEFYQVPPVNEQAQQHLP